MPLGHTPVANLGAATTGASHGARRPGQSVTGFPLALPANIRDMALRSQSVEM
jgi:hypothetical protein